MKKFVSIALASIFVCVLATMVAFASDESAARSMGQVQEAQNLAGVQSAALLEQDLAGESASQVRGIEDKSLPIETAEQLISNLEAGGDYYLTQDIILDKAFFERHPNGIQISKDVTLHTYEHSIIIGKANEDIDVTALIFVLKGATFEIPADSSVVTGGFSAAQGVMFRGVVVQVSGTFKMARNFTNICSDHGVVKVGSYGKFYLRGNIITCSSRSCDSIVSVEEGADLEFEKGSIVNCSISNENWVMDRDGAVLRVIGTDTVANIASGVEIVGCTAKDAKGKHSNASAILADYHATVSCGADIKRCVSEGIGGAVVVNRSATYKMTGGCISGGSSSYGAVYAEDEGKFILSGGTIGEDVTAFGSMIYIAEYGQVNISGGTVAACSSCNQGGCVTIADNGTFGMSGGTLLGAAKAKLERGGCIYAMGGTINLTGGVIDGNGCQAIQGGLIYFLGRASNDQGDDIEEEDAADTENGAANVIGGSVVLQYGRAVDKMDASGKVAQPGQGGAIYIESGQNVDVTGSATIKECLAETAGGAFYLGTCTLAMSGSSTITNCNACVDVSGDTSSYGGALYLSPTATFKADGNATITNCSTDNKLSDDSKGYGGALYMEWGSSAVLGNGFKISDCTAKTDGGAICIGGSKADPSAIAKVELANSTITACTAGGSGGAIYARGGATIALKSLEITGNSAQKYGGAICATPSNSQTLSVNFSGKCTVKENTSNSTSYHNLFLDFLDDASGKRQSSSGNIQFSTKEMAAGSEVYVGATDAGINNLNKRACAVLDASWEGAYKTKGYFNADAEGNVFITSNGENLCLGSSNFDIYDAASYVNAVDKGGEWWLACNVDASTNGSASNLHLSNQDLTIHTNGKWLKLNTLGSGYALIIDSGKSLLLDGVTGSPTLKGGVCGMVDDTSPMRFYHPLFKVESGAELNINADVRGCGCCASGAAGGVADVFGTVTLQSATVSRCYKSPALSIQGGTLRMLGSIIEGGKLADCGTCIFADRATIEITNSKLIGSYARFNGGCLCVSNSTLSVSQTTLSNGSAGGSGGGIFAVNSQIDLDESTHINQCTANKDGGGVYYAATRRSSLLICAGDVSNCSAGHNGGGYCINSSFMQECVQIIGSSDRGSNALRDCKAGNDGGGIYLQGGAIRIDAGLISDNEAQRYGGAIALSATPGFNCTVTLNGSEKQRVSVSDNHARKAGSGIYIPVGKGLNKTVQFFDFSFVYNNTSLPHRGSDGHNVYLDDAQTPTIQNGLEDLSMLLPGALSSADSLNSSYPVVFDSSYRGSVDIGASANLLKQLPYKFASYSDGVDQTRIGTSDRWRYKLRFDASDHTVSFVKSKNDEEGGSAEDGQGDGGSSGSGDANSNSNVNDSGNSNGAVNANATQSNLASTGDSVAMAIPLATLTIVLALGATILIRRKMGRRPKYGNAKL